MDAIEDSAILQGWLQRLAAGDPLAREGLIKSAEGRLIRLTRRMLRNFPIVSRWELTDDVFQNSIIRLHAALAAVAPKSVQEFVCFAAFLIRRELIDLSRHYGGPLGLGLKHKSDPNLAEVNRRPADSSSDPVELVRWTEFHQAVGNLPDELRTVVDLLWYQELPQSVAAEIMQVSERTVQRRWLEARLKLHSLFQSGTNELFEGE